MSNYKQAPIFPDGMSESRFMANAGALVRNLTEFANRSTTRYQESWQRDAYVGYVGPNYTVTERGPGYAVASFANGATRTIYAPVPFI